MTASHFTTRLQLPYPDENDPADVPLDISNLAWKLDTLTARTPGAALTAAPILDVGVAGQIRAGRQLTAADFTALGLAAPAGLWNLSDVTDASGNGRTLVNKGAVPFGAGINGAASTAAVFSGSTAQALYISDAGAADPFRIRTGSWGCWFRTAKASTNNALIGKYTGTSGAYWMQTDGNGHLQGAVSFDGTSGASATGVSTVADSRWHFGVITFGGTAIRLYVDAVLEAMFLASAALFPGAAPLNIGALGADASAASINPSFGPVDEAFVTADVLSPDQIRALYCAKIPHGFAVTPTRFQLNVRRQRKGAALATTDFPTQPLRLHNFTGGTLADQGSGNVALTNNGAAVPVAGADGAQNGAFNFVVASSQSLSSTDAGLPAGTATRSYGCWFKTTGTTAALTMLTWGNLPGNGDARLDQAGGAIRLLSAGDVINGPWVADGIWHSAIGVEDNAAGDGVKRKLYLDGVLVGGSTVLNAITLAGANHFRVGAATDGTYPFAGQIDGAFVCGYALTQDQISTLYAKGSQAMAPSPKNTGDHVEYADATNVYCTFDTLESQHQIDLAISG